MVANADKDPSRRDDTHVPENVLQTHTLLDNNGEESE